MQQKISNFIYNESTIFKRKMNNPFKVAIIEDYIKYDLSLKYIDFYLFVSLLKILAQIDESNALKILHVLSLFYLFFFLYYILINIRTLKKTLISIFLKI